MLDEFRVLAFAGLDLLLSRVLSSLTKLKEEDYWTDNLDRVAQERLTRLAGLLGDMIAIVDQIINREIVEPESLEIMSHIERMMIDSGEQQIDWGSKKAMFERAKKLCETLAMRLTERISAAANDLDWLENFIKQLEKSLHTYLVEKLLC